MVNADDVNKYLISVDSGVINRTEEQAEIWSEFDQLGLKETEEPSEDQNTNPPKPEDFAKWFETNNSVDLRALLRDIEIVFIEAALDRNSGNTSEAAKDLKLLRTTLLKNKKYSYSYFCFFQASMKFSNSVFVLLNCVIACSILPNCSVYLRLISSSRSSSFLAIFYISALCFICFFRIFEWRTCFYNLFH